jgi:hypothetical protein
VACQLRGYGSSLQCEPQVAIASTSSATLTRRVDPFPAAQALA